MPRVLVLALLGFVLVAPPAAAKPKKLLAPLTAQAFGEGDCGCTLRVKRGGRPRKVFVVNAMDDVDHARMNLRGKDVTLAREGAMDKGHDKLGDRYTEVWKAEGVRVQIDYTVSKTCAQVNDDGCEGVWTTAKITGTLDGVEETLEAAGYCGC